MDIGGGTVAFSACRRMHCASKSCRGDKAQEFGTTGAGYFIISVGQGAAALRREEACHGNAVETPKIRLLKHVGPEILPALNERE